MVTGMPKFRVEKEGICLGCVEGKLKRGPFPSILSKTSDILQLVHSGIPKVSIKRETTTPHTPDQNGVAPYDCGSYLYDDVTMPDVEEPMDPIYPPEPSSSRKRPSWLRGILDDAERHVAPRIRDT